MKPLIALTLPLAVLAACSAPAPTPADSPPAVDHSQMDHSKMDHSGHDMGGNGGVKEAQNDLNEAQTAFKAVNDRMHAGMADIPADADVAFMQGMLAHHRGAVEMSEVALKYAKDEKARDLATRIIAAQKGEIAEMEAWLKARGGQ